MVHKKTKLFFVATSLRRMEIATMSSSVSP